MTVPQVDRRPGQLVPEGLTTRRHLLPCDAWKQIRCSHISGGGRWSFVCWLLWVAKRGMRAI